MTIKGEAESGDFTVVTGNAASTDPAYSGFTVDDVTVTNTELPGIIVMPTSDLSTTANGTATFTIVLRHKPTDDVTIPISSSDPTRATVSVTSVTFSPTDFDQPKTVTVTGGASGGDFTIVTGKASTNDTAYSGFDAADVKGSNTSTPSATVSGVVLDFLEAIPAPPTPTGSPAITRRPSRAGRRRVPS